MLVVAYICMICQNWNITNRNRNNQASEEGNHVRGVKAFFYHLFKISEENDFVKFLHWDV